MEHKSLFQPLTLLEYSINIVKKHYKTDTLFDFIKELLWDYHSKVLEFSPNNLQFQKVEENETNPLYKFIECSDCINFIQVIKNFALNYTEGSILELHNFSISDRYIIHKICNKLKFFHSENCEMYRKILIIEKPKNWSWNLTEDPNSFVWKVFSDHYWKIID